MQLKKLKNLSNSPDIHTWLIKTHSKLTRQACRVTRGQPWTSCCPCSLVVTDTWSRSRASCWGRTASGSHTAGTSPMGTGAAWTSSTRMAPSDREVNRTVLSGMEVNRTAQSGREAYRTAGSHREVNRTAQSKREANRTAQSDREVNKTAQSKTEVNRTAQSDRYCTGRWMEQLNYSRVNGTASQETRQMCGKKEVQPLNTAS